MRDRPSRPASGGVRKPWRIERIGCPSSCPGRASPKMYNGRGVHILYSPPVLSNRLRFRSGLWQDLFGAECLCKTEGCNDISRTGIVRYRYCSGGGTRSCRMKRHRSERVTFLNRDFFELCFQCADSVFLVSCFSATDTSDRRICFKKFGVMKEALPKSCPV